MRPLRAVRVYTRHARDLARCWKRPLVSTAVRMLLGRVLYGRGPVEFDEHRFTVKPVRRWREYVIDDERRRLQSDCAPVAHRRIDEDKLLFWERCTAAELPVVPTTAVLRRPEDPASTPAVPQARTGAELAGILGALGDFDGFAKPIGGGQGYGAFAFRARDGRVILDATEIPLADLFEHCMTLPFAGEGYLIQPHMRVHPALAGVMPGPGLGTLRAVTFLMPDGAVEIPWAMVKCPAAGQVVSSRRIGRSIVLPVDRLTGGFGHGVGPTPGEPSVHEVERHPETGVRFQDVAIPDWASVVGLLERGAHEFRELPALGWDVVLTDRGPLMLETNWAFGMAAPEIALDRGLRSEFADFYARCARSRE